MRSAKRYSNVTFTKRVDHEAGRHHTARAPAEPLVCTACGAVYRRRRWIAPESSPDLGAVPGGGRGQANALPTVQAALAWSAERIRSR